MVTVVTVLLFAYSPGGKVELLLLLWVGRKCPCTAALFKQGHQGLISLTILGQES